MRHHSLGVALCLDLGGPPFVGCGPRWVCLCLGASSLLNATNALGATSQILLPARLLDASLLRGVVTVNAVVTVNDVFCNGRAMGCARFMVNCNV